MRSSQLQLLLGASLCLPSFALAQESPAKSEVRVLFVGHDPESRQLPFGVGAADRTYELYRERTTSFDAFLREHFEDVTTVFGSDYTVAMSDEVDVTIFDDLPKPLTAEVREIDGGTGKMRYEPASYLPQDFSHPVLMIGVNSPRIGEPLGLKLDWL